MNKLPAIPVWCKQHAKLVSTMMLLLVWASCARFEVREGWDDNSGPVIPHDTFPADCTLCHTGTDWVTLRDDFDFDHEAETGVTLNGAHAQAQCLLCHNDRGPVANFAERGCAGCHVDVHLGRLGNACQTCHAEDTWRPVEAIAQHNRTRLPLIGSHAAVDCTLCHEGAGSGVFLPLDVNCVSCHLADYNATSLPNHASSGFGTACQDCHVAVNWSGTASMSHPDSLPLSGGHGGLSCTACHLPTTFTGLSPDCVTCHLADSTSASPPHASFGTNCTDCHSTNSWFGATVIHPSSFPLNGGHSGRSCTDCHSGGIYTGLSTSCVSCHLNDYNTAGDPNHISAGFPTSCQDCHSINSWQGANFDHDFPITSGRHRFSCITCHTVPGNYTTFSCIDCHEHSESKAGSHHGPEISGYVWSSPACYSCHPQGRHD